MRRAWRTDNVWGMGTYDLDLGLKRRFPIWESVKLQFEADILNVTNHVVFSSPNGGGRQRLHILWTDQQRGQQSTGYAALRTH